MNKLLAAGLFVFLSYLCSIAQSTFTPAQLSPADLGEDIRLLVDSLDSIHPGLDRYNTRAELASALAAIRKLEANGANEFELYLAISRYLAAIRCDHTKAELPSGLAKYREENPSHFPFRFVVIKGRMYVCDFDKDQAKVERGTEILKINGKTASELINEFSPFVSVDGFTDHVKPFKLSDDSDLLGSDLDHFYPLRYGFGPNVTLAIKPASGRPSTLDLSLISYKKWRSLGDGTAVNNFSDPNAVVFKVTGADTAYLRVATFINYRTPVDPYKVFSPLFDQIRERGIKHLIVDLRQNGGGSDDVGVALGRYLLTERAAINSSTAVRSLSIKAELRPFLQTWNRSVFDLAPEGWSKNSDGLYEKLAAPIQLEPLSKAFGGRVTFLTSSNNASGVVILMSRLRDLRPIRLVGEETGGSSEGPTAGVILFLELPKSKIRLRIPVYRSYTMVKRFIPGKGLIPDIKVNSTLSDLVARRDRALEAAMKSN